MATKDIDKLVEDEFIQMAKEIRQLDTGSEEHSRATKDWMSIYSGINEKQKIKDSKEDQEARREETKRMNDADLYYKNAEFELSKSRAEAERQNRNKNLGIQLLDIMGRNLVNACGMRMQGTILKREILAQNESLPSFDRDTMRIYDKLDRKIK